MLQDNDLLIENKQLKDTIIKLQAEILLLQKDRDTLTKRRKSTNITSKQYYKNNRDILLQKQKQYNLRKSNINTNAIGLSHKNTSSMTSAALASTPEPIGHKQPLSGKVVLKPIMHPKQKINITKKN